MTEGWLAALLARNAETAYLRRLGSPRTVEAFRETVPVIGYDELAPWIGGEPDVLFAGRPVAFERTSGMTGAAKLIPYSSEGLRDFQRAVSPWLARVIDRHGIS